MWKWISWIVVIVIIVWAGYFLMQEKDKEVQNTIDKEKYRYVEEAPEPKVEFPDTTGMSGKG